MTKAYFDYLKQCKPFLLLLLRQVVKWDEADPLQHLTRPKPAGNSPLGVKSDAYAPPDIMAVNPFNSATFSRNGQNTTSLLYKGRNLHFGVMHSFETDVKLQLLGLHFLLASITQEGEPTRQ